MIYPSSHLSQTGTLPERGQHCAGVSANPQNLNRYSYVNNSPLMYTDPSGHRETRCTEGTVCKPEGPTGGHDPDPDKEEEDDDYLIDWFDTTLTPEQTTDLLYEIDWWLKILNSANDALNYLPFAELAGIATVVGILFWPAASLTAVSLVVAVGAWALENMIDNTISDLQDLRYEIAVISNAQRNPEIGIDKAQKSINISAGQDIFSWGVTVNGQATVSHSTINMVGMPNPSGQLNLTPLWLNAWYQFDLGK